MKVSSRVSFSLYSVFRNVIEIPRTVFVVSQCLPVSLISGEFFQLFPKKQMSGIMMPKKSSLIQFYLNQCDFTSICHRASLIILQIRLRKVFPLSRKVSKLYLPQARAHNSGYCM